MRNKTSRRAKQIEAMGLFILSQCTIFFVAGATIEGRLSVFGIGAGLLDAVVIAALSGSFLRSKSNPEKRIAILLRASAIAFALGIIGFILSMTRIGAISL